MKSTIRKLLVTCAVILAVTSMINGEAWGAEVKAPCAAYTGCATCSG